MSKKLFLLFSLALAGLAATISLHAQFAAQSVSVAEPVSESPDSIVQLTAEAQGLELLSPAVLPRTGTFWVVTSNGFSAPFPCPPRDGLLPTYGISGDIFLVDDTGGQVNAKQPRFQSQTTGNPVESALAALAGSVVDLIGQVQETELGQTMAMAFGLEDAESFSSFGSGGSGGGDSPNDLLSGYDYGTSLWIARPAVTNHFLTGIGSNTLADVQYEIQSRTNLAQTDWQSEGFILGSEVNNWTPLSVAQNNRTNLFLRLRSWADDGSGLPLWWQQQYFGTNGVDAYGDPDGDGWNNLQEFQNGNSPLMFNTPAAPRASATLKINNHATVSWQPVSGPVIGYRIEKSDPVLWGSGVSSNYFVSADTLTLEDDLTADFNFVVSAYADPEVYVDYAVYAQYAGGNSAPGLATIQGYGTAPDISLVTGSNGRLYHVFRDLPPDLKSIRVYREEQFYFYLISQYFTTDFYNMMGGCVPPLADGFFEIPASQITNGVCSLPDNQVAPCFMEQFSMQTIRSNGVASAWSPYSFNQANYSSLPFVDLRRQMKDNLTFLLRAAPARRPFIFTVVPYVGAGSYDSANSGTTNLAVSSIFFGGSYFNPYRPVEDNCIFRNFAFDQNYLAANGYLNTGIYDSGANSLLKPAKAVTNFPAYYFNMAAFISGGNTNIPASLLPASQTRWITPTDYSIAPPLTSTTFPTNRRNFYGLPFVSAQLTRVTNNQIILRTVFPGETNLPVSYWQTFLETAQPVYQLTNYYFAHAGIDPQPESFGFAKTNATRPMFLGVGSSLTVAGYAKLNILNSTSNKPAYLGQYFEKAEKMDGSGNTTGVLSPYGNFFANEPGDVALVTMPDIDTGARGTNIIHCIGVSVDKNHDGVMDVSFSGADATSQASPMTFWVNDDFDRGHTVDGSDFEQDDLSQAQIANLNVPAEQKVPDCQYLTNGYPAIPCTRDLEDYFRLWTPGLAAAMRAMPTNYTVWFYFWGDAEVRVFQAVEPAGGTNYLFDAVTASNQVAGSAARYIGKLANNEPINLNITTNFNEHFIVCGAKAGNAQMGVYVGDADGNEVLYAPVFLQIQDLKQMYERWTVGDAPNRAPLTAATNAVNDLPAGTAAFNYPTSPDTNTPYILFVHGWNMETWEKDRYAETVFKRLYWQGYQGRFGSFRWPTYNGWPFKEFLNSYDKSEARAWNSGAGLRALLNNLNTKYPDQIRLIAHSMGNVVAGEALRTPSTLVQVYVAMQAAIPAGAYDLAAPFRGISYPFADNTPELYRLYPLFSPTKPYFSQAAGAAVSINFFNQRDFALNAWEIDQNLKPDDSLGYTYNNSTNTFFQFQGLPSQRILTPSANTFELFAYCVEGQCHALGAQTNVAALFTAAKQVDLDVSYSFGSAHKGHSAQFRSDNAQRTAFWSEIMTATGVK